MTTRRESLADGYDDKSKQCVEELQFILDHSEALCQRLGQVTCKSHHLVQMTGTAFWHVEDRGVSAAYRQRTCTRL